MKFSLFFEMQIADATAEKEVNVFHDCLEQAILADSLGYHCIWEVEHHGLYEYSHSSAPEIFLSFVAALTKTIRIGHGCTLLPYRYNHPIRVAERIATLDILSQGRVNWGSARSASRVEREAFEIDGATIHEEWCEAIRMIPQMWRSEVFSYKGKFFDIPPTCIIPKPVQQPHPPMFAACSRPSDSLAIGQMGIGALNLAMYREDQLEHVIRQYRQAIVDSTPVGLAITNHFACSAAALVLDDDYDACRYGLTGATYFTQAMIHYYGPERPVGKLPGWSGVVSDHYVETFRRTRHTSTSQLSSVIGDPTAARDSVQRFVDVGVDELILVMQTGTTPHDIVMKSIRTFGEDVMPWFA